VSISGGVAAITSAYPTLAAHTVLLCVVSIGVLMLVNLRGVHESGAVFSIPTYVFIIMMLALIGVGLVRSLGGLDAAPAPLVPRVDALSAQQHAGGFPAGFALIFLMLRAFAEGCVAMTGTE